MRIQFSHSRSPLIFIIPGISVYTSEAYGRKYHSAHLHILRWVMDATLWMKR